MNTTTLNMTTLDGGVIIKKGTAPAPPSGGESASTIEYLDVSGLDEGIIPLIAGLSMNVKWDSLSNIDHNPIVICPWGITSPSINNDGTLNGRVLAIALDQTLIINDRMFGDNSISIAEFIQTNFGDMIANLPRLTKEQFYSLD